MTVVVAFHCTDGVVIAADSMLTPSMGNLSVGHHHGVKIATLAGPQLFAFAGDQGQAMRFRVMAETSCHLISKAQHPLEYPIAISQGIIGQLQSTGISMQMVAANTILGFEMNGTHHCCMFEGALQPRLLDEDHYYAALGSGKMHADPFLRFLADIFCAGGRPNVREGIFLASWTVQHVIDVNPGGVAGPIRVGILDLSAGEVFQARTLQEDEIAEHQQAVESAGEALRTWRDQLRSGEAAEDAPKQPEVPEGLITATAVLSRPQR